jgi:hypothetical protein
VEAVFPIMLHQDPRYFVMGHGGFWKRTGYALSREVVTRGDDGESHFNTSEIAGNAVAAGISNLYYPAEDRSLGNTANKWGQQIAPDAFFNVVKEHARALPGTEGATFPFWSPDSHALGFFAAGKLKTVLAEGGTPFEVCDAPTPRGGTWSSKGIIVFAPTYMSTLSQVAATGGVPQRLTVMDHSRHDSHRWPRFLPDGDHFLYLAVSHHSTRDPNDSVYFASIDGKKNVAIMRGHTEAVY